MSVAGTKRTRRTHGLMSAYRGELDSRRTLPQRQLLTQCGHSTRAAYLLGGFVRSLILIGSVKIQKHLCSSSVLAIVCESDDELPQAIVRT